MPDDTGRPSSMSDGGGRGECETIPLLHMVESRKLEGAADHSTMFGGHDVRSRFSRRPFVDAGRSGPGALGPGTPGTWAAPWKADHVCEAAANPELLSGAGEGRWFDAAASISPAPA